MQPLPDWIASALRPYPFRGKLRLLDPLLPRQGERSAEVFDARMDLDLADAIQRDIYLGTYEPRETAMVRTWLRPGMTFVDVGANVGYFTALAASAVGPTGRVFAVEPQPAIFERLENFLAANSLHQVKAIQAGLSDEPGDLPLYLPADLASMHNATMVAHEGARQIRVPVKTLDACLAEWGVDRVDLMKIDVEGHELRVFRGATAALKAGRIRALLCEFNDLWLSMAGASCQELHQFLRAAGFVDRDGSPSFAAGGVDNRFLYLER